MRYALIVVTIAILANLSSAFANDSYCEGPGCPVRFEVGGFDVWVSPNIYDAVDFSHERLGLVLDLLRAQISYIDPPTNYQGVPDAAVDALRAEVSFYFSQRGRTDTDVWWPCGKGFGCYDNNLMRIGFRVPDFLHHHAKENFALHELAHAYHALVIEDGYQNQCIIDAYERSVNLYDHICHHHYMSHIPPHEGAKCERAYAATNVYEWFAEGAESYWLRNGSEPFTRHDLWELDPDAYNIQRAFWHDPDAACPMWVLDE